MPGDVVACGATVTLDGSCSLHGNPGRTISRYEWDLDNNGTWDKLGKSISFVPNATGEHTVRLRVTGRLQDLPKAVRNELERVMAATRNYEKGHLILALSYGGRAEIVDAVRAIASDVRAGKLAPEAIDEKAIAARLYLPDVPDPDLMIRTSGELRLSNFLLWELSYAEFYFTDTLWPDFREPQFAEALAEYSRRQRRFGAPS